MQSPILTDHDTASATRIQQLEETILELYQSVCPIYGTINFAQVAPENFELPYSIHSMRLPNTTLNVTFITNPPHLMIGTPTFNMSGPLQWDSELTIELPKQTIFVHFEYVGEVGKVQWASPDGSIHLLPPLPDPITPDQPGHFYLARHDGITSLQITSTGKMLIHTLAVGISAPVESL